MDARDERPWLAIGLMRKAAQILDAANACHAASLARSATIAILTDLGLEPEEELDPDLATLVVAVPLNPGDQSISRGDR